MFRIIKISGIFLYWEVLRVEGICKTGYSNSIGSFFGRRAWETGMAEKFIIHGLLRAV